MKKKILFLSARPRDKEDLDVYDEWKKIKQAIVSSDFELPKEIREVHIDEISNILENEPSNIVHFSGHGEPRGLYFLDKNNQSIVLSIKAADKIFNSHLKNTECVIFNACNSFALAECASKYTNYAIGINGIIEDEVAREFTLKFYENLNSGRSYQEAFEEGCMVVDAFNAGQKKNIPALFARKEGIVFFRDGTIGELIAMRNEKKRGVKIHARETKLSGWVKEIDSYCAQRKEIPAFLGEIGIKEEYHAEIVSWKKLEYGDIIILKDKISRILLCNQPYQRYNFFISPSIGNSYLTILDFSGRIIFFLEKISKSLDGYLLHTEKLLNLQEANEGNRFIQDFHFHIKNFFHSWEIDDKDESLKRFLHEIFQYEKDIDSAFSVLKNIEDQAIQQKIIKLEEYKTIKLSEYLNNYDIITELIKKNHKECIPIIRETSIECLRKNMTELSSRILNFKQIAMGFIDTYNIFLKKMLDILPSE